MTTFRGSGINASTMMAAVFRASNDLSRKTLPAGASWPFVTLSLDKKSVDFRMPAVHKTATTKNVTKVSLNKLGYVLFSTHNHVNDFGFVTIRMEKLLAELEKLGYPLDETVKQNRLVAKVVIIGFYVVTLIFAGLIATMAILKPNGV